MGVHDSDNICAGAGGCVYEDSPLEGIHESDVLAELWFIYGDYIRRGLGGYDLLGHGVRLLSYVGCVRGLVSLAAGGVAPFCHLTGCILGGSYGVFLALLVHHRIETGTGWRLLLCVGVWSGRLRYLPGGRSLFPSTSENIIAYMYMYFKRAICTYFSMYALCI